MNKHIINLDLHGGDFAPNSVLEGAAIALSKNPSIHFKLHSTKELQQQYSKKFSNLFQKSDWIQSENFISPEYETRRSIKKR
jgi:fatty acid/phospholipid biosynthesis enzyme